MITRARVDGMTCQHCIRAVFTALAAVDGIVSADVSLGEIVVEHDGRVTGDQLRDAVAVAGYAMAAAKNDRRALRILSS
jgi:copper chaperone